MALATGGKGTAPYAPTSAITKVIDRYREAGFGGQSVNEIALQKIGVSESLIPRTLATLRQLDLIDENGNPTDQFGVLKNAASAEFRPRLAEWLKDSYAPIFGFCNPATATAEQIEDAFRGYTPEGQRGRMASLFTGLAAYAGIIEDAPSKPRGRHASPKPKPAAAAAAAKEPRGARTNGAALDRPPAPQTLDAYRQRYVDLLIAKAESQDDPDADLLDRIERALGIAGGEGQAP